MEKAVYDTITNETYNNVTAWPDDSMGLPPALDFNLQAFDFQKYAYMIMNPMGIVCNLFVFYIFTKTKLKRYSTAQYLAATAIADSGFLLALMVKNLNEYRIPIYHRHGGCQLVTFGLHAFPFLIRWYLCCAVVDQFIGVHWPLKKPKICTVFSAKCVVICLAIVAVVCYLYVTWHFYSTHYEFIDIVICTLAWDDTNVLRSWFILTKMDAVINCGLPYILMLILTCLIAVRCWICPRSSLSAGDIFPQRRGASATKPNELKTMQVIVITASVSIILCAPNCVQRLRELDPTFTPSSYVVETIVVYCEALSSCIRIFIYTFCSHRFARQVRIHFPCLCRKLNIRKAISALMMTETDIASTSSNDIETATERKA